MDIEVSVSACVSHDTLRRLARRSNAPGLLQLGSHFGVLCATGFLIGVSRGHAWLVGALTLHGIVLCFLFCALHECIHRTAFKNSWLNESVAWICGALLMLPPEYFRQFHFAHHRFTQDAASDPELAAPVPANLTAYLWRVSGLPYWWDRLIVTLRHAFTARVRESFIPAEKARGIVREAQILWTCYLCILAASLYWQRTEALIYWLLPAILGQPFLRLFLLAEHAGCAFSNDMLENTRTTLTNPAVRGLTWRMSYHAEHHCFPSVPFHALPELHALIGPRIRVTTAGYLTVHREMLQRFRAQNEGLPRGA